MPSNMLSLFVGFPSIHIVEMAAYNWFDAVVLDNEHGMLSDENIEHLVIAAENAGVIPWFECHRAIPFPS